MNQRASRNALLLLALAGLYAACSAGKSTQHGDMSEEGKTQMEQVERLEKSTVDQVFRSDLEKNDLHFLAVSGYTIVVPGVKDYWQRYASVRYKIISGTGDEVTDAKQLERQNFATDFAERYNRLVLEYLKANASKSG